MHAVIVQVLEGTNSCSEARLHDSACRSGPELKGNIRWNCRDVLPSVFYIIKREHSMQPCTAPVHISQSTRPSAKTSAAMHLPTCAGATQTTDT